jgi:transposase-like protein
VRGWGHDETGQVPQELRERAVRVVFELQDEHPSLWSAITSIATKFGVPSEALPKWSAGPKSTGHQARARYGRR